MKRVLIVLALLLSAPAFAAELRPLDASQIPALLAPPAQGERLIALWSLDCSYCKENLQALAKLQRRHPERIELIIVATDTIAEGKAITQHLRDLGVESFPARAYADATPDRLNYLLDPNWGGELPRVLVIRPDGSRRGVSGLLDQATLRRLEP